MEAAQTDPPTFVSVLFPCESRLDRDDAFAHALRIAVGARSHLSVVQVLPDQLDPRNWREPPAVRRTLEDWGMLSAGSAKTDVWDRLGVQVRKAVWEGDDPVAALIRDEHTHHPDLVVLATEGRTGLPRWLEPSVAEKVSRALRVPALFVPATARGFVDAATGSIRLERVLIPVDEHPDPGPAIEGTIRLLNALGIVHCQITVLHVGDDHPVRARASPDGRFELVGVSATGEPASAIAAAARESSSDLVVMATAGHEGLLDAVRGSVSERVLREASCPVLTVPSR